MWKYIISSVSYNSIFINLLKFEVKKEMFQLLLSYFKIIQYQIIYYFLGAFAVFDDLQNRSLNKFSKINILIKLIIQL